MARESVYFNAQDPARRLFVVASLGVRPGARGEALLAIALPDGRVLFGLELAPPRSGPRGFRVGGAGVEWSPVSLAFEGRLAAHEAGGFPPAPLPLLLAPRTHAVSLRLAFSPATPAFDMCQGLAPDVIETLRPLGRHHVEQSGRWHGSLVVDGRHFELDGWGARDHSWGLRDWEAADHWRLFTLSLGQDLAVHALAVSVGGRLVEGGFVWRDGRAERVTRVRHVAERRGRGVASLQLEVASAVGPPVQLRGSVLRVLRVPVQVEARPLRHLSGRPYRMILEESFTRYEAGGRSGFGMAELTRRGCV
jgi:hypothetical protein